MLKIGSLCKINITSMSWHEYTGCYCVVCSGLTNGDCYRVSILTKNNGLSLINREYLELIC